MISSFGDTQPINIWHWSWTRNSNRWLLSLKMPMLIPVENTQPVNSGHLYRAIYLSAVDTYSGHFTHESTAVICPENRVCQPLTPDQERQPLHVRHLSQTPKVVIYTGHPIQYPSFLPTHFCNRHNFWIFALALQVRYVGTICRSFCFFWHSFQYFSRWWLHGCINLHALICTWVHATCLHKFIFLSTVCAHGLWSWNMIH